MSQANTHLFRGREISGARASALLRAIKLVQEYAPRPTDEDVACLEAIKEQFRGRLRADLAAANNDPEE